MTRIDSFLEKGCLYSNDVPVLTRFQIEDISEHIIRYYMPTAQSAQAPVNIEALIENTFNLQLDFQIMQPDGAILGETIFTDGLREVFDPDNIPNQIIVQRGTILLDESLTENMETRLSFTEAHELGHWVFHKRFYGATMNRACRSHRSQRMYFPHNQAKTPIEWTEWQANTFAASLLLPRSALRITLQNFLESNNLTWKELSDFSEYKNREKYVELLQKIAHTYGVSRDTARIRMNKLCNIRFPN